MKLAKVQGEKLSRLIASVIVLLMVAVTEAPAQQGGAKNSAQSPPPSSATVASRDTVASLATVASRADFDVLARVHTDLPYALPHVLFVIDRKDNNRIYYINSHRYRFHRDFINGTYLSLERGQQLVENNYLKANRRFIMGTLAYQTPVRRWTFEFWEGDLIPSEQIQVTFEVISKSFFDKVAFKPNSARQQEASSRIAGLGQLTQSDIIKEQEYQPLNLTSGIGRIHIIERLDDTVEIGSNEIVVLSEVPIHLPPVAGIITTKPSTPLSHINLLAKSWGVPNAYIKNAGELFKQYDGWWVSFTAGHEAYAIKRAGLDQVKEYQRRLAERQDIMTPRFDLTVKRIASLAEQRAQSVVAYGAKSANLGEMINARRPGIIVPDGWTIPFFYYDQFIKANKLEEVIYEMLNDQTFVHNPSYRRKRLSALRELIKEGHVSERLRTQVLRRTHAAGFAGRGLFVRSSTNTEDLPNFNGAGLYTTMPNVRGDKRMIDAIKAVWASVWNFEAYEARERAGINHSKVYMGVLVQQGVEADSAGVMITTDPYNSQNIGDAIYISAKRGLGISVVEGQRIAEQIIFRPQTNSMEVLTRSAEDSLLVFDEAGGVKKVPIKGERAVLTDKVVRRLAHVAQEIKRIFGSAEQDIEWVYQRGQIYIVQSRPYIAGS